MHVVASAGVRSDKGNAPEDPAWHGWLAAAGSLRLLQEQRLTLTD